MRHDTELRNRAARLRSRADRIEASSGGHWRRRVTAAVAMALLVAAGAVAADGAPRLIIERIRCIDPSIGLDATRTVVIEDGCIVELSEPGDVQVRAGDRVLRGEGRYLVTGQTIVMDSPVDLLTLRRRFVEGVTTVLVADDDLRACLVRLTAIPSLRVPRVGPLAMTDAVDASPLRVGARADLLIRRLPHAVTTEPGWRGEPVGSIHLLLTARSDLAGANAPGGVLIVYPGELGVLPGLLERLARQIAESQRDMPHAAARLGGVARGSEIPMRRGLLTIDAIPRGVVWTWQSGAADGAVADHLLIRMLEPLNLWAHIAESSDRAETLQSIEVAIAELNIPQLRDRPEDDPQSVWARAIPIDRTAFTVRDGRLVRDDPPATDSPATRGPTSLPLGRDPSVVLVSGLPTARTARLLLGIAGDSSLAEPHSVEVIHVAIDPLGRGVSVAKAGLSPTSEGPCLPNHPLDGAPRLPIGLTGLRLVEAARLGAPVEGIAGAVLRDDDRTIWMDAEGGFWGLLQNTRHGLIAYRADDDAISVPPAKPPAHHD